ncbi:MAG: CHASE2 domain-containing protein [Candidatus Omnitrophica bacterium]|nr:CHASE2 domain-containing protein [Candidatus Omnitrophota bacterium]MBD3269035.1 CHASE2 domain-containing protein [Candidatus Omnitrophota bacterium]
MRFLKKIPPKAAVLLFFTLLIFLFSSLRVFNNYELIAYDLFFKLRPGVKASEDIVIIEISDDTIKNLGQWPLPRDFHASLIKVLSEFGAKAVVFDILFSEKTLYDNIFARAIEKGGNVYFPLAFYLGDKYNNPVRLPPESKTVLGGINENFKQYLQGFGHINVFIDEDGKIRRAPLFIENKNNFIPHLALRVACDSLGLDVKNIKFRKGEVVIDESLKLPVSSHTSFLVNYPGPWGDAFKHLSYFQILKAFNDYSKGKAGQLDLSQLKGKVCFVGLTATGTSDIKSIPLESAYPLLGLGASIYNSIVTKDFITKSPMFINTLINLGVFLVILFVSLKLSPLRSFFVSVASLLLYFFLSLAAFIFFRYWIDVFSPVFIIAATYTGSTLYKFVDEARKKEFMEKELDIARQIQKSFLPSEVQTPQGLHIDFFMQAAKFVGGDLYDFFVLDEKKIGIFIGDVSGKGVPASLIMAQTISIFRVFAPNSGDPAEVLTKLNNELCKEIQGRFVTAMYIVLDTETNILQASCAGHSPLIIFDKKKSEVTEFLPDSGFPLGIMAGFEYSCFEKELNKGDRIFLYTDGVTECRDKKGGEFGVKRVKDIILNNRGLSFRNLREIIKNNLFSFSKGLPQFDDTTFILAEIDS